jgi:ribosome-associated translation inhibitor RaiA
VEVILHAHHAPLSDYMRARAERAARRLGDRLERAVDATVRFEVDGKFKRVELVLNAPLAPRLVSEGSGKFFGPALNQAVTRMETQLRRLKRTKLSRARKPQDA